MMTQTERESNKTGDNKCVPISKARGGGGGGGVQDFLIGGSNL